MNVFEDGSVVGGQFASVVALVQLSELVAAFQRRRSDHLEDRIEPGKSVDLGYAWHYFWR